MPLVVRASRLLPPIPRRRDACTTNLPPKTLRRWRRLSRGFCHGWLDGPDHRSLVSGEGSTKRGVLLGEVRGVRGDRILVELVGPLRRGDGVVFEGDRSQGDCPNFRGHRGEAVVDENGTVPFGGTGRAVEQGGRVYEIFQNRRSIETEVAGGTVELAFRYGSIDRGQIRLGQKVWKTDDPLRGPTASSDVLVQPIATPRATRS